VDGPVGDLVTGRVKPGVYQWRTATAARGGWRGPAERAGWHAFHLDGHLIRGKDALLRHCAEAFAFPRPGDWDELEAHLADLSWLPPARGRLLVYEAWTELAETEPASFRAALDVLTRTAEAWRDTVTPVVVLLPSTTTEIAGVPKLA
jgi:hypothetical protein